MRSVTFPYGIWSDERISGIVMRVLAILFHSFMISAKNSSPTCIEYISFNLARPSFAATHRYSATEKYPKEVAPTTKRPWPFKIGIRSFPKIPPGHCEFLVLLAAKSWRRKANFPLARAVDSAMVPLLVVAASLESGSCEDCGGGEMVKRKVLSMRMIWLKLGLMLGSSTQHDCMMKARSGDISSGRAGLSCLKAAA